MNFLILLIWSVLVYERGTLQISKIRKFVKFVAKNTRTLQISKIRKLVKFVAKNKCNSCINSSNSC